ncbi:GD25860 [Drosophila simulans]|uniref:GD25860 n=1 Tax=Drosophila simulans TaxID=7240 RepID=B4QC80_DROSI|nr:GD25860 [Drosophila simulans]
MASARLVTSFGIGHQQSEAESYCVERSPQEQHVCDQIAHNGVHGRVPVDTFKEQRAASFAMFPAELLRPLTLMELPSC